MNALTILTVMVLMIPCGGCSRKTPSREYFMEKIGGFYATSAGNQLDENFYIIGEFDNSLLGLSVQGSQEQLTTNVLTFVSDIGELKFALQLFQANSSNDFYRAEIFVRSNCVYYPLWKPDLGYLITGVEPFPYSRSDFQQSLPAAYRYGKDVFPLANGKPLAGVNYHVRITVDTPVMITNRFQLWLYSYKNVTESK